MYKKNALKEFARFMLSTVTTFYFSSFFFKYFLLNEVNIEKVINDFNRDISRFLSLEISIASGYLVLIYSLIINLLLFSSYWYNNPQLYEEGGATIYSKIFQISSLATVFIFYFLRIFNTSRFYLIIFMILVPFIFILFRSEGIMSSMVIRNNNSKKFILVYQEKGYGDELYLNKYIDKNNIVKSIDLGIESNNNLFQKLVSLQKTDQFDFILINIEDYSKDVEKKIINLIDLKKPVLIAIKSFDEKSTQNISLKKVNINNINLFVFNTQVQDGIQLIFKRLFDLIISTLLLVFLGPIFLIISILIYFNDFNSPIVSIYRSGIYGKEFKMYKFRTMYPNSHKNRFELQNKNLREGPLFKIENDPRVINKFNWLRRSSLDELPQLINVIKGDMSLVGPRPLFKEDLINFKEEQTIRMSVLPGITGLLQINDRETEDFNIWFKWDKEYIDTWSLKNDLKILLLTPFKLSSSL